MTGDESGRRTRRPDVLGSRPGAGRASDPAVLEEILSGIADIGLADCQTYGSCRLFDGAQRRSATRSSPTRWGTWGPEHEAGLGIG